MSQHRGPQRHLTPVLIGILAFLIVVILLWAALALVRSGSEPQAAPEPTLLPAVTFRREAPPAACG
jgi:ABC-type transporter Mla subunit MlaD